MTRACRSIIRALVLGVLIHSASVPAATDSASAATGPRATRLSDWLYERRFQENAYLPGLSVRVPDQVPVQHALRLSLVARIDDLVRERKIDAAAAASARAWLESLPVTGRLRVVSTEARWLRSHPQQDPVLSSAASVYVPVRPHVVAVIRDDGRLCRIVHRSGLEAKAYVNACLAEEAADWAWVAQPDGLVQRAGVAVWNQSAQDVVAPGAWIWAPRRGSGWPESLSADVIRFVATQGPVPDASEEAPPTASDLPSPPGAESTGLSLTTALAEPRRGTRPEIPPNSNEPVKLRADAVPSTSRALLLSASDWGSVGLLQTPTARMRIGGAFSISYSRVNPYTRGNVFFQPFDWMEAGFRYTTISGTDYGNYGDIDKSIDVKFRLLNESAYLPELAVGLRDVAGTGKFSSEFVVATKRTGDFDWSLGLGWGYLGARGNIKNPLSSLDRRFDERVPASGPGGQFALKSYFRGPAAVFGGVQYHTPWDALVLKGEYDGNDYKSDPFVRERSSTRRHSPFNIGLTYRAFSWADVTLGFERGNTAMLSVSVHSELSRLTQPKWLDPPTVPVSIARPAKDPDWARTMRDLEQQSAWSVDRVERRDNDVRVVVDDAQATYWRSRLDRIASVLNRDAPEGIDRFTITYRNRGVDVAEHVVNREAWVEQQTQYVPPASKSDAIVAQTPQAVEGNVVATARRPAFEQGVGLHFDYTFGTIDAPVLYRLALTESARLRLRPDTWLQAVASLALVDNYDEWLIDVNSALPRVRTRIREYVRESRFNVPNLQITHVGKFGDNHFYSAYAGYLEMMFGGVGAEWLYRPFASPVAVGIDVNAVRQRELDQHFGFLDYKTVTGHATLYWDTGWEDVQAKVSAGRYLAKDWGATLTLSRVFKNGVSMGAWATKTNVSAATFGEGSFDKGIFLTIPFDSILPRSTGITGVAAWRPILRDGGAMLARAVQLYGRTSQRSDRTLESEPAPVPNWQKIPEEHIEESMPQTLKPASQPHTRVSARGSSTEWERRGSARQLQLTQSLYDQGFRNIKVEYDPSQRVLITLSHPDMRPIARAVGRAARAALLQAPAEARGINITFVDGVTPQVRYEFFNLDRLSQYFDGKLALEEVKPFVNIQWLSPAARTHDPYARLDDADPDVTPRIVGSVMPDTLSAGRVINDFAGAAVNATKVDWLRAGALGAGLLMSTHLLDSRAYRVATDHQSNRWFDRGVKVGNALPIAGIVVAGALALDGSDPVRSRTGYAAVEAGATAYAAATGLKYLFGRARPTADLGKREFNWLTSQSPYDSFPSRHTAVAWAVATPFALEYDMPWLYGVAALTNLARVGSREHWLTDTIGGSLLGYGLGRLFWQSGRDQAGGKVYYDGSVLGMRWPW